MNRLWHTGRSVFARHEILVGAYLGSLGALAVGLVVQFAGYAILARYLGAHEFGLLMTITAATAMGYHLCGIGSSEMATRRIARNRFDYARILGHSLILTAISGAVLSVVVAFFLTLWTKAAADLHSNFIIMLAFSLSHILFARIVILAESVMLGYSLNAFANILNTAFNIVRGGTAVIVCVGFGTNSIAEWAAVTTVLSVVCAAVCLLILLRIGTPHWVVLREEVRLGVHFTTPWFFLTLRQNIGVLVLSAVAPITVTGIFAAAQRTVDASQILTSSINRILYATLAVAGADGGAKSALRMIRKNLTPILALAAAASIGLFVAAPLIPILFGPEFDGIVYTVRILSLLPTLYAVQGVAYDAMGAADLHRVRALIYNTGTICGAALAAALTYTQGVMGLMASLYLSEAVTTVALWLVLTRLASTEFAAASE